MQGTNHGPEFRKELGLCGVAQIGNPEEDPAAVN
jgi:hypothetical protein